jgi:hypothetical protein
LFPKFVPENAAMYHELRQRGTSDMDVARELSVDEIYARIIVQQARGEARLDPPDMRRYASASLRRAGGTVRARCRLLTQYHAKDR